MPKRTGQRRTYGHDADIMHTYDSHFDCLLASRTHVAEPRPSRGQGPSFSLTSRKDDRRFFFFYKQQQKKKGNQKTKMYKSRSPNRNFPGKNTTTKVEGRRYFSLISWWASKRARKTQVFRLGLPFRMNEIELQEIEVNSFSLNIFEGNFVGLAIRKRKVA